MLAHKKLPRDDGTLHYWVDGSGEDALVFLHGATMDHGLFEPQIEEFADRYTVLAPDLPHHGASTWSGDFDLSVAAESVRAMLDAEGLERVHLVGQSMGGFVAQMLALHHPARVHSVTVVDSAPLQPAYYGWRDTVELWIGLITVRLLPMSMIKKAYSAQLAVTDEGKAYVDRTVEPLTKARMLDIMRGIEAGVNAAAKDGPLSVPVLITVGANDGSHGILDKSQAWAAREHRQLEILPDASHNANQDNPTRFNAVLTAFLEEYGASSP